MAGLLPNMPVGGFGGALGSAASGMVQNMPYRPPANGVDPQFMVQNMPYHGELDGLGSQLLQLLQQRQAPPLDMALAADPVQMMRPNPFGMGPDYNAAPALNPMLPPGSWQNQQPVDERWLPLNPLYMDADPNTGQPYPGVMEAATQQPPSSLLQWLQQLVTGDQSQPAGSAYNLHRASY